MPLRRLLVLGILLAGASCAGRISPTARGARYDVLIAGGTLVDGTGRAGYAADVALRGERIVRISRRPLNPADAARVVDARGLVVAPGFIDTHAHIEPLLRMRGAESSVRQGVTTIFGGQDGDSPWPLAAAYDSVDAGGAGLNVGYFVGHGTLREQVIGMADRAPTPDELARMRALVAQGMREGAWGLSTGLEYVPGIFARVDELWSLAEVAGDSGGMYSSHVRDEGAGLLPSIAEVAEIARRGRVTGNVTHMKASGRRAWGRSGAALALIDSVRRAGVAVTMDQYPYTATSTGLSLLVPAWALEGGDSAYQRRARDPAPRERILREIAAALDSTQGGREPRRVQFARVSWDTTLEGRTLEDWLVRRGMAVTPENGALLVLEGMAQGGASCVYHVVQEDDVERIMRHPLTIVVSDGGLSRPGVGHPHPRAYGTFVRVLGRYLRERQVLTLEEAVRKMTALPAERLGIAQRGRLAEGWYADVVVFDPATVADAATFERPHQYAVGVPYVLVNGRFAVDGGASLDVKAGRALRHRARGR